MGACSGLSALQLSGTACTFLLVVLWLDVFWVKIALSPNDIEVMLRRQTWLNAFVAFGALCAAALLLLWVDSCSTWI